MDKPPTKAKRTAEAEDGPDELDARLRQLAQDSFAAFYREPTEENLQRAQLLLAISSMPDRRRELALYERRLAGREAPQTNPKHPDKFWRKVWVRLIPPLVADCDGDPDTVARELIAFLPATLRAKCPDYPTNQTELERAVAAVLEAKNFRRQVAEWVTGEQDVLKLARAVLRGCGMTKDDAKSLLRSVSDSAA
jgi:hypothetical protein